MSYIRRLPSGKWQATVRGPDGTKHTRTDKLKSAVRTWAAEQEAALARGDFRDPRLGRTTVGEWWERVARARGDKPGDRRERLWRLYCEKTWGRWPIAAVTRVDAQEWASDLASTPSVRDPKQHLAPATVHAIVSVMTSLYRLGLAENPPLVTSNPFHGLDLPVILPHSTDFLEHAEAAALQEAAGAIDPRWRVLTQLGFEAGLRPGELYGLRGHRVDWLRGSLQVVDVMTRYGLREHPKSKKSHRTVPVPPHVLEGMSRLMQGRARDSHVFVGVRGAPMTDDRFSRTVWHPAVTAAGVRRFPPRIMRHTAASWLVMDGVPLYDVQALLGHESFLTTQRYAHLAPDAHSRIIAAWERRRAQR